MFRDRADAGSRLGARLRGPGDPSTCDPSTLVVGISPGGLAVACEVARSIEAPLDVCIVRKIADPRHPDRLIAAVSEDGSRSVDHVATSVLGVSAEDLTPLVALKGSEVAQYNRR